MIKLYKFYSPDFNREQYWDTKYASEHIAGRSSEEFRTQGFWPLLEQQLQPGGKYLDAGCGIGGWILFLREQGYNVEGIDAAARAVRALTEYDPTVSVKIGSITAIPAPDASFDGVIAVGTLEYLEDAVPRALRDVHRVLKDNGVFFLEVPLANTIRRLLYLPLKRLQYAVKGAQGHHSTFANYLFDRRQLPALLAQHGFSVEVVAPHELPAADSHYGLYIDWPWLRGAKPYQLNLLGRLVKAVANGLSPWIASTGMVVVARKKSA